jgi:hypothetical protein
MGMLFGLQHPILFTLGINTLDGIYNNRYK